MISCQVWGFRNVTCSFRGGVNHHTVVVPNILADVPEPYK